MANAPTPEEQVSESDAFSAAFDTATTEPAPKEPAPKEPAAPAAAAETPPAETPPADDPPADDPPADDPPADDPPAPEINEDDEDDRLLQRLARVIKTKGDEPAPRQPEAPAPKQPTADELPPILTEEERQFVADYEKDWPDVARAEATKRKAEYAHLTGYIFQQVMNQFGPVAQMVQELAAHAQLTQLEATVPDYAVAREEVIGWVNKQPTYLQNAYQHVIRSGTVDEVADLIARYRAETGAPAAAPAPGKVPAPVQRKKEAELPTATRQAAASLAPVSSKRSVVPSQDDPNDFASAFEKFDGLLK